MESRIFLGPSNMPSMRCGTCKNYLSVPPITISSNIPVCGRCAKQDEDIDKNRASFYEELAKFMFFPCINDIYGCLVKLRWGEVLTHEIDCSFGKIVCPAVNCESKIESEEVIDHFKNNHETLIMKDNEYSFSPFCTENVYVNKLLIWKDHSFIVQTKTNGNDTFFRLSTFNENESRMLIPKLTVNSKGTSSLISCNEFKIMKYDYKFPNFSIQEKINVQALRSIFGPQIRCIIDVADGIYKKSDEFYNNKMLSELECPICIEYMTPPIYMCPRGHSICAMCKSKQTTCPICSMELGDNRNISLEKICEHISYPCKNRIMGCCFVGNVENLVHHEASCSISIKKQSCCLINHYEPCYWKGRYAKIIQHINSVHPDYIIKLNHTMCIYMNTFNMKNWFSEYDNRIFNLYVDQVKTKPHKIRWTVSHITNREEENKDKYMFYLDILSDTRILLISETCRVVSIFHKNINPILFVNLPMSLLQSFIKNNQLKFKLNVVKMN